MGAIVIAPGHCFLFTLHHIHGRKFENELRFSGLEQLIAWTPFLMLLSSFRPKYIFNNYIFFRFFCAQIPFHLSV